MQKTNCTAILTLFTLVLATGSTLAAKGPTDYLKSYDKKIQPLLTNADKNKERIFALVQKMINFKTLCKNSLGKHWAERTAAEQQDFSDTLEALIKKNMLKRLKSTNANNVIYQSEKVDGNKATVVTIVRDGDGPRAAEIEIAYKLVKKGAAWTVVDMETDGVSLVANYRSQFNKLIKKEGWDAMMKKMKDKLAK